MQKLAAINFCVILGIYVVFDSFDMQVPVIICS